MKKLFVILFVLVSIVSYGQQYRFEVPKASVGTTTFPVGNGDVVSQHYIIKDRAIRVGTDAGSWGATLATGSIGVGHLCGAGMYGITVGWNSNVTGNYSSSFGQSVNITGSWSMGNGKIMAHGAHYSFANGYNHTTTGNYNFISGKMEIFLVIIMLVLAD